VAIPKKGSGWRPDRPHPVMQMSVTVSEELASIETPGT